MPLHDSAPTFRVRRAINPLHPTCDLLTTPPMQALLLRFLRSRTEDVFLPLLATDPALVIDFTAALITGMDRDHDPGWYPYLTFHLIDSLLDVLFREAPQRCIPVLHLLIDGQDCAIRSMGIGLLGTLADPATIPSLVACLLMDGCPENRDLAAWGLGRCLDPAAVPALQWARTAWERTEDGFWPTGPAHDALQAILRRHPWAWPPPS